MNRLMAALGAAACVLTASAGIAADPLGNDPLAAGTMTVRTDDLDMASRAGQATYAKRIARAAESVCGARMDRIALSVAAQARDCKIATIAEYNRDVQAAQRAMPATAG